MNIAVMASGRGSNLGALIDASQEGRLAGARLALVFTDQALSLAGERGRSCGIETISLSPADFTDRASYENAIMDRFDQASIDLVVLAGYMRILTPAFIHKYQGRIINIHPSLLPLFPGLEPQQQALDAGVRVSGCTVHFVDQGMDTGPIIAQRCVPVRQGDTAGSLAGRILKEEHQLLVWVVEKMAGGHIHLLDGRVYVDLDV